MSRLENVSLDEVFTIGLHEFITTFLDDNNSLGKAVAERYPRLRCDAFFGFATILC